MKLLPLRTASIICLLLLGVASKGYTQELNCIVQINGENLPNADQRILDEMQNVFAQFLNEQIWTEDQYEPQERINCIINLTLQSVDNQTLYQGTAQIQASRPVYGTNYQSLTLRYVDPNWQFEYNSGQSLNYNPNAYTNDITSLLSYFANVILAMDYDSFSPLGGDPYWQQAWNIVNLAQSNNRPGWDQFANNGRNRYEFANLMANGQMNDLREGWYTYHLKGMDVFQTEDEEAREQIAEVLKGWQAVNRQRPNTIASFVVMETKSDELIKVYSQGDPGVRQQAYNVLVQLDPTNTTRYDDMVKN